MKTLQTSIPLFAAAVGLLAATGCHKKNATSPAPEPLPAALNRLADTLDLAVESNQRQLLALSNTVVALTTERVTNAFNRLVLAIDEAVQMNERHLLVLSNTVAELQGATSNALHRVAELEARNRQLADQTHELSRALVKAETTATLLGQQVAQQNTLLNSAGARKAPAQNLRSK
jgi:hypothetical protein